jgi:hypothetical protein
MNGEYVRISKEGVAVYMKVLYRYSFRDTEENQAIYRSRQPVTRPRFEVGNSQIQIYLYTDFVGPLGD